MKYASGSISTLGSLVEINQKRLSHYKRSADKAREIELKLFFMRYAVQSQGFINCLTRWMMEYGKATVKVDQENNLTTAWNKIMETMQPDSSEHLLSRADKMELDVLRIYKTILSLSILPSPIVREIQAQSEELETTVRQIKSQMTPKVVSKLKVAA